VPGLRAVCVWAAYHLPTFEPQGLLLQGPTMTQPLPSSTPQGTILKLLPTLHGPGFCISYPKIHGERKMTKSPPCHRTTRLCVKIASKTNIFC
jgi:hypothetical protein